MFSIVEIAGHQYKVAKGDVITTETISGHKVGDTVKTDKVLLRAEGAKAEIGMPYVSGAHVSFEIKEVGRGEKIRVFKKKPKKRYQRTQGHRQAFAKLEVTEVK
jgi:large subunit ribosomal protein L21